jgi:hypothetical protein
MKKRIHVNQHAIKRNQRRATDPQYADSFGKHKEPVLTVKTYKSNHYGHRVKIDGPSSVIYQPDKPLSCGARVWIETTAVVEVESDRENFPGITDIVTLR